jgi:sarcosine oxidase subunit alpha
MPLFRFLAATTPPAPTTEHDAGAARDSGPAAPGQADAPPAVVPVTLDGAEIAEVPAAARLSLAFLDGDVGLTMRSAKYRRPRTGFCMSGDCGTCLVRVDGLPNRRACMTPVTAGARVERQNTLRPPALDPTRLVDTMLRGGMDHHHFVVRPWIANQLMQGVARHLAGIGELPAGDAPTDATAFEERALDVLVIGAGLAGVAVAAALRTGLHGGIDTRQVAVVDRHDAAWLATHAFREGRALLADQDPSGENVLTRTSVFGIYPEEGLVAAVQTIAATDSSPASERLLIFRPHHLVFATGSRDPLLPFGDNDRPGVVAARGLLRQLAVASAALDAPVVVVGDGPYAATCAAELGPRVVATVPSTDAIGVKGAAMVRGLRTSTTTHACRLVAVAGEPMPASDLAVMSGLRVRFDGAGFAVETDAHGRCTPESREEHEATPPWTAWAAGDVTGYLGPTAAFEDGRRVGQRIAATIRAERASAAGAVSPGAPTAPPDAPETTP